MPPRQSQKPFFKNKLSVIFFILIFLGVLFVLFFADKYFEITDIQITSSMAQKQSVKGLENFQGKNLLLLSEEQVKQTIQLKNPTFSKVEVQKIFPNKLYISLSHTGTQALLKVNQGFFYLGGKGIILKKDKKSISGVPIITYYQLLDFSSYTPGDVVDFKDILTAMHFINKTKELGLNVDKVDIGGLNVIRLHVKDSTLIFSTEKDLKTQDYQLEKIIYQFKIEGKSFEYIDFRFDKPVIKLK